MRRVLYPAYESRVVKFLPPDQIPRHVGVILDGNRRWARSVGESTRHGHQAGADKIADLLEWSEDIGVEVVTLWMLSTDNLAPARRADRCCRSSRTPSARSRPPVAGGSRPVGRARPAARPDRRGAHRRAGRHRADIGGLPVNVAVGYGGRRRSPTPSASLLHEHAARAEPRRAGRRLDVEHIAEHLYTKGQPDPDLVIRTSGEQRLRGFLLWQSARTRSSTSARRTGPTSGASTSCAPFARTRPGSAAAPSRGAASAPLPTPFGSLLRVRRMPRDVRS